MADDGEGPVMVLVAAMSDYQIQILDSIRANLADRSIPLLVVALVNYDGVRASEVLLELIGQRAPRGVIGLADGAIFQRPELVPALQRAGLPVVSMGMRVGSAPCVIGDPVVGMRALMRHLLDECGVRRLAVVRGIPTHVDSKAREEVLREEFARRGLDVDEDLVVDGLFIVKAAYDRVRELLRRRPDVEAVVAFNDASAFGALAALTDEGLRVPEDVLLAGFDNCLDAATSWPPLTSVDPHLQEQGARAVELLLELVAGRPCPQTVQIPAGLVVRTSTSRRSLGVEQAMASARALQARVVVHELAMQISSIMAGCETVADVRDALATCLEQVGITRCFLALDAGSGTGAAPVGRPDPPAQACRLAFSYRRGEVEEPAQTVFSRHELLPAPLRGELEHGSLLLIPLSFEGRERGYLLYDLDMQYQVLLEALRMELPRTVEMVFSWEELTDRTSMLERLVGQRTRELERVHAELERSVLLDGLTGIANRRAFETEMTRLCRAGGDSLALLMVDVDLFKPFNDRYGHLAGDDALRTVADCLRRAVRGKQDLPCRYGGEEFAVVLTGCGLVAAHAVAERFPGLLAEAAIPHEASPAAGVVTASVGIAAVPDSGDVRPEDLIAAADDALYRAKAAGRNRVMDAKVVGGAFVPRQRGGDRDVLESARSPEHSPEHGGGSEPAGG